jgi:hypothetical protein
LNHGGHLKEIPEPHIRRYPNPYEKRQVKIRVSSWVGVSVGAVHTYVRVHEEENPLWRPAWDEEIEPGRMVHWEDAWQAAWDDKEAAGREFEKDVLHLKQAAKWLAGILKKNFPTSLYKIIRTELDTSERLALRYLVRPGD